MHRRLKKYLGILRLELDDLADHCEELVEQYRNGRYEGKFTEHVMLENIALFKNEECGFRCFVHVLDEIEPENYEALESLVAEIKRRFREILIRGGLAHAAYVFAEKKVDKVAMYIEHPCDTCEFVQPTERAS